MHGRDEQTTDRLAAKARMSAQAAPGIAAARIMHTALRAFFQADGARVACAHRDAEPAPDGAREYIDGGFVSLIDLGERADGISSSTVRAKIARGDASWKDMVSSSMAQYILQHGLYAPA